MRLRFAALVVFAVAAVTLSGCASSDADQPATAPPPSVGPATGAPSATPPTQASGPVPSGSVIAIRGTIKEGVEPGCVLLSTDSKSYLLLGGDRTALKSGVQVTVYGIPQPDVMTTCQQGTPFQVTKIEP